MKIRYFEEWKPAAAALLEAGLRPMRKQPFSVKKSRNIIRLNRQAPILDQLFEFLTKRFAEFIFLPRKYFENLYPLNLADGPLKPDGVETTIYTSNESLF